MKTLRAGMVAISMTTLALATAIVSPPGAHSRVTRRPNILIILTDDQRAGLGVMPATRRIFKKEGVFYENAYVTDPLCCPSRASIMTGRYPHNTGVKSNSNDHPRAPGYMALDQNTTVQYYLHRVGYTTGIIGKFLNQWPVGRTPPHFDRWWITDGYYRDIDYTIGSGAGSTSRVKNVSTYSTTFDRKKAVRFLDQEAPKKGPWYLYVAPSAPHMPYTPQARYATDTFGRWRSNPAVRETDRSDKPPIVRKHHAGIKSGRRIRTKQFRTLESVDDMVKAIFARLRALGEADNTLAFFMSDNGYMWGEHGVTQKDYPYPQSVDVPLLARWPGHLAPGTIDARRAANVDITPTIMQATGTVPPAGSPVMDGRSLLSPYLRTRQLTEHWCNLNRCIFWASDTTPGYQYTEYYGGPDFPNASITFREYYDLSKDPWELTNLLHDGTRRDNPDTAALHQQLMNDFGCAGQSCP